MHTQNIRIQLELKGRVSYAWLRGLHLAKLEKSTDVELTNFLAIIESCSNRKCKSNEYSNEFIDLGVLSHNRLSIEAGRKCDQVPKPQRNANESSIRNINYKFTARYMHMHLHLYKSDKPNIERERERSAQNIDFTYEVGLNSCPPELWSAPASALKFLAHTRRHRRGEAQPVAVAEPEPRGMDKVSRCPKCTCRHLWVGQVVGCGHIAKNHNSSSSSYSCLYIYIFLGMYIYACIPSKSNRSTIA